MAPKLSILIMGVAQSFGTCLINLLRENLSFETDYSTIYQLLGVTLNKLLGMGALPCSELIVGLMVAPICIFGRMSSGPPGNLGVQ